MKCNAKKLLSILFAAAVLVSVLTVAAGAVGETIHPAGDPLSYTVLSDGSLAVTGCDSGETSITIPSTADGKTVTAVASGALKGYSTLVSLTIPNTVKTIGEGAFANCVNLTSLTFESGSQLTEIGKEAFAYTGKDSETVPATIESLTLPASVETLGIDAFRNIPVAYFALENNSKLTEIPDGFLAADGADGNPGTKTECTSIWDYVRQWFIDLFSPYPKTPEQIAKAADCLTEVHFGDKNSLERIGMGAFKNQTHLTVIDFGKDPDAEELEIARGAFVAVGNNKLTGGKGGIETLTLPANLSTLGSRSFDFANVKNVVFADNGKLTVIPDGFMEVNKTEINSTRNDNGYPSTDPVSVGANSVQTIRFGSNNSVELIGEAAFRNQSHLTSIDFGTSAADLTIDQGAFIGAGNNGYYVEEGVDSTLGSGIEMLVFPANLVKMDYGAFDYARVKNVKFSDGCKLAKLNNNFLGVDGSDGNNGYPSLEKAALAVNCLESVDFGANNKLESIGYGAFKNQSHLTSIKFGTSDAELSIESGAFIGVGNNGYLVDQGIDAKLNGIETLTFPANLSKIGVGAFDIARVKNIVFSDNCKLKELPYNFMGMLGSGNTARPGKGYIWDPETENGENTFILKPAEIAANCLESVKFGKNNSLAQIGYGAFNNQSHLTKIDFGSSSAELCLKDGAFAGAGNNAYLVENGVDTELCTIETLTLPANLAELKGGVFNYSPVKNLVFEDNCKLSTIPYGFMNIPYEGCNGYPNELTNSYEKVFVEDSALLAANKLETISFGKNNGLTLINGGAFKNQSHVTSVDFGTPANELVLGDGAFIGVGNNAWLVENGVDEKPCGGIETLTLPANVVRMEEGCFEYARVKNFVLNDNSKLEEIPSGFMGVHGGGCNGCPGKGSSGFEENPVQIAVNCLESVKFGANNSLTEIGYGAFYNQSHLTEIDFGTPVNELELLDGAFIGVGNNAYLVENGVDTELNGIETLTIPANVVKICEGCFEYASVRNLVLNDNSKLEKIPRGFMGVHGGGCNGCPGKGSSEFEENPVQIAVNCLESVKFGANNSLKEVGYGAFYNQSHLTEIDFGTPVNELVLLDGAFIGVGNNAYLVENGVDTELNGIETLTIPANVAQIETGVFDFARIKNLVFEDNSKLTKIPSGFMQISGKYGKASEETCRVGANCLESVNFGKNGKLEEIGYGAFHYQSHLTDITFDNETTLTLKAGAFQGLEDLEELVIDGTWDVTALNGGVFSSCNNLKTVNLLDSKITSIDDSLKNNPKLTCVIFPRGLTSITWSDHNKDTEYDRPEEYEKCPFYGCGNVSELHFSRLDPSGYSFDNNVLKFLSESGIVYVPAATTDANIEAYKTLLTKCGLTFAPNKWVIERQVDVTGVTVEKSSAGIYVGESVTVAANVQPENASWPDVTWSSSDPGVAVVDEDGKVTGVNPGTAVITVTTDDGGFTASYTVQVKQAKGIAYSIDVNPTKHGKAIVSAEEALPGTPVIITVYPDSGFTLETLTASFGVNRALELTDLGNGRYRFIMPYADVEITATFMESNAMLNFFVDVKPGDYCYDAVLWAAENGITNGTDAVHFSPNAPVTRAQAVTFLWRAAGCPEPVGNAGKFTDVAAGSYYEKAVAWAVEKGITKGTTDTTFSPYKLCTRAQIVTFLARFAGVADTDTRTGFTDVKATDYYAAAVKWAKDNGITTGKTATLFAPGESCTRGQVVTFLYRLLVK